MQLLRVKHDCLITSPSRWVTIKATKNLLTIVLLSREKCCYTISKKVSPGNLIGRCCCCPQKCFWDCSKIPKKRKNQPPLPPEKKFPNLPQMFSRIHRVKYFNTRREQKNCGLLQRSYCPEYHSGKKCLCVCVCACARGVSNSWCIYEIVHMLGLIYFLGSLKDKAVWVVLRPSFLYRC